MCVCVCVCVQCGRACLYINTCVHALCLCVYAHVWCILPSGSMCVHVCIEYMLALGVEHILCACMQQQFLMFAKMTPLSVYVIDEKEERAKARATAGKHHQYNCCYCVHHHS